MTNNSHIPHNKKPRTSEGTRLSLPMQEVILATQTYLESGSDVR